MNSYFDFHSVVQKHFFITADYTFLIFVMNLHDVEIFVTYREELMLIL